MCEGAITNSGNPQEPCKQDSWPYFTGEDELSFPQPCGVRRIDTITRIINVWLSVEQEGNRLHPSSLRLGRKQVPSQHCRS